MLAGLQTQMRGLSLAALLQLQPPSAAHGNQLTAVFRSEFNNCFQNYFHSHLYFLFKTVHNYPM